MEIKTKKLSEIALKTVDIKGVGYYSLGNYRKEFSDEQFEEYLSLFEKYLSLSEIIQSMPIEIKHFLGNTSICPINEPYNWLPLSYRTEPIERAIESGLIVSLTAKKEISGLI